MARVTQVWIDELSLKQQTVLLCALRGCDGMDKEDKFKNLTRLLRNTILNNADKTSSFMNKQLRIDINEMLNFCSSIDKYPLHFILHFIHACEIIGYNHPDDYERYWWFSLYSAFCQAFHMNPETKEQNNHRLKS